MSQRQPPLANTDQLQVTSEGHTGGDNSCGCTNCYCFSRYHLKGRQGSLFQVGTQGGACHEDDRETVTERRDTRQQGTL